MGPGGAFPQSSIAQLREVLSGESCLAAIYAFGLHQGADCSLAALFTETSWNERLDLELAAGKALGMEGLELIDLRRMSLVLRFRVVNQGEPIFVGQPEVLAQFIEETTARYSAFYPLLEALYWEVETKQLPEDMLDSAESVL